LGTVERIRALGWVQNWAKTEKRLSAQNPRICAYESAHGSAFSAKGVRLGYVGSMGKDGKALFRPNSCDLRRMAVRFARMAARFARMAARFARMAARFARMAVRFARMAVRFARMAVRFARMAARFARMAVRFARVAARFARVEVRSVMFLKVGVA
jgi:hypothetical protein